MRSVCGYEISPCERCIYACMKYPLVHFAAAKLKFVLVRIFARGRAPHVERTDIELSEELQLYTHISS